MDSLEDCYFYKDKYYPCVELLHRAHSESDSMRNFVMRKSGEYNTVTFFYDSKTANPQALKCTFEQASKTFTLFSSTFPNKR